MSTLDIIISSDIERPECVGSCIAHLASNHFDPKTCEFIKLSVVEAITNCIVHSYCGVSEHKITIGVCIAPDKIKIDVSDAGSSMNPADFEKIDANFEIDPFDIENLAEGSRGVKVIKATMDESYYYSQDGINHLVMTKYVKPPDVIPHEN